MVPERMHSPRAVLNTNAHSLEFLQSWPKWSWRRQVMPLSHHKTKQAWTEQHKTQGLRQSEEYLKSHGVNDMSPSTKGGSGSFHMCCPWPSMRYLRQIFPGPYCIFISRTQQFQLYESEIMTYYHMFLCMLLQSIYAEYNPGSWHVQYQYLTTLISLLLNCCFRSISYL